MKLRAMKTVLGTLGLALAVSACATDNLRYQHAEYGKVTQDDPQYLAASSACKADVFGSGMQMGDKFVETFDKAEEIYLPVYKEKSYAGTMMVQDIMMVGMGQSVAVNREVPLPPKKVDVVISKDFDAAYKAAEGKIQDCLAVKGWTEIASS